MAKRPQPGRTKTRLIPSVGPHSAHKLYEAFLLDTLETASSIEDVITVVAMDREDSAGYFEDIAPTALQLVQRGPDLGSRLVHVMTECGAAGFDKVVAIGSDSPTVRANLLRCAFDRLDDRQTDVVIGPADDGGYYLIGWSDPHPEVVLPVEMSTERVLADTLDLARKHAVNVQLIDSWYDIDTPADLIRLRAELVAQPEIAAHTRSVMNVD